MDLMNRFIFNKRAVGPARKQQLLRAVDNESLLSLQYLYRGQL